MPYGGALLAPQSFYDAFPLGAPGWVAMFRPFNEHLVLAGAAWLGRRDVVRVGLVAFLVLPVLAGQVPDGARRTGRSSAP